MSLQEDIETVTKAAAIWVAAYPHEREAVLRVIEAARESQAVDLYREHFNRLSIWMGDRDGEAWRSGHDISERVIQRAEAAEAKIADVTAERDEQAELQEGWAQNANEAASLYRSALERIRALEESEGLALATLHEVRIVLYEIRSWLKAPAGSLPPTNERGDHWLLRHLDKIDGVFVAAEIARARAASTPEEPKR